MSIWVDENTKVVYQGMSPRPGNAATEYASMVVPQPEGAS